MSEQAGHQNKTYQINGDSSRINPVNVAMRTVSVFLPALFLLLAASYYVYDTEVSNDRKIFFSHEQLKLSHQQQTFTRMFHNIIEDLVILSYHSDLREMVNDPDFDAELHKQAVTQEFLGFASQKPEYHQIRFIANDGMELIRINSVDGKPVIVPESQLQNKADRYYFKESFALDNRVYISRFDLNIENGKIETPRRPMIRFGIPVIDFTGIKQGVLVLNYQGDYLINELTLSSSVESSSLLINEDAYWLKGLDPDDEWGFMYPSKQDTTLKKQFPDVWQHISQEKSGQLINEDGLITFTTLSASKNHPLIGKAPKDWKLASFVPTEKLNKLTLNYKRNAISVTLLLSAVLLILCVILAHGREQKHLNKLAIQEKDETIRQIVNSAFDGIITMDDHGIINSANPAACTMFGYEEEELIGNNIAMLADDKENAFSRSYMKRYIRLMKHHFMGTPREILVKRKDGSLFPMELCGSGKKQYGKWIFTGICRDITERKAMIEKLEQLATTDALTSLYNRGYFNIKLEEEFQRCSRYDQDLSLLIMDADHFKSVNDDYGHPAGDAFLIALAQAILGVARQVDIVARYGGEEFVLILPQTNGDDAMILAERLRLTVEQMSIEFEGHLISRTTSIGIASLQEVKAESADELLTIADQALYAAKESGRNRVIMASI